MQLNLGSSASVNPMRPAPRDLPVEGGSDAWLTLSDLILGQDAPVQAIGQRAGMQGGSCSPAA